VTVAADLTSEWRESVCAWWDHHKDEPVGVSELYSVASDEAAVILRVSPRTLWGLTNNGDLRCVKIGRSVRYDRRDLAAYIKRQRSA
jgi:excisionase family DNA binding protein